MIRSNGDRRAVDFVSGAGCADFCRYADLLTTLRKLNTFGVVVSIDGCNTSDILGGCVDIYASCEEGAGAASSVGQAAAVDGAAGSRVGYPGSGSGGRCHAYRGQQLG